jgi:hypothetical protein
MRDRKSVGDDRATVLAVARAIHLARCEWASFPGHPGPCGFAARLAREPWPEDRGEAEALLHAGQPWMDLAVAQARAALSVARARGV